MRCMETYTSSTVSCDTSSTFSFNAPSQVVIAGNKGAVEKAIELCKTRGAKRGLLLPVSAPFHSSLLRPAAERLAERNAA